MDRFRTIDRYLITMLAFLSADPTTAIAIVASIALVSLVSIVTFFALAPTVSPTWAERLDAGSSARSFEHEPQHGD